MTDHQSEATEWLTHVRNCVPVHYVDFINSLRRELEAGGLTPEDIGTSDAEIEELRVKGCKSTAVQRLGYLRAGDKLPYYDLRRIDTYIDCVRRELEAGGLTPEDIGTSDAEIENFKNVLRDI